MMRIPVLVLILFLGGNALASSYTVGLYLDRTGETRCAAYATEKPFTAYLIAKGKTPFACAGWELGFVLDSDVYLGIDEYPHDAIVVDDCPNVRVDLTTPIHSDQNNTVLLARCTIFAAVQGGIDLIGHSGASGTSSLPRLIIIGSSRVIHAETDRLNDRHCLTIHTGNCGEPLTGYYTQIDTPVGRVIHDCEILDPPYELFVTNDHDSLFINGHLYNAFPARGAILTVKEGMNATLSDWSDALGLGYQTPTINGHAHYSQSDGLDDASPWECISLHDMIEGHAGTMSQLLFRKQSQQEAIHTVSNILAHGGLELFYSSSSTKTSIAPSNAGLLLDILHELHQSPDKSDETLLELEEQYPGFIASGVIQAFRER